MDLDLEIAEIGQLITSAAFLMSVRHEVNAMKKNSFIVTDGKHHPSVDKFDVVVKCGDDSNRVARKIRKNMPDARVKRIADGVLGVNNSRRM